MEMFDAFRTYNHIAFFQDAHWFSIDARTAFSFNNDQNLSDRVCVPERSAPGSKITYALDTGTREQIQTEGRS